MENDLKIYGISAIGLTAGAFIGYKIGDKYKKNAWLFAGIGALAIGFGTYMVTTQFVYVPKTSEETSGFLGFGKKAKLNKAPKERKCWCATSHGMEQCPCAGNSDKL